MKLIEKLIGILSIILIVSQLANYISSLNVVIILCLLLLSSLYFALGFALFNNIRLRNIFKKESYKGISTLRIIGTIGAGIALSIIVIGVQFKFYSWPFRNQHLIIGLSLLAIITIPVIIKFITTNGLFYRNLLIRFFIIGSVGFIFLQVSSEELIEIKFRKYPDYVEAKKALLKDSQNEALNQKVQEEWERMKGIRK